MAIAIGIGKLLNKRLKVLDEQYIYNGCAHGL